MNLIARLFILTSLLWIVVANAGTPPNVVSGLSISSSSSDLSISWSAVTTDFYGNSASISHYNVYQGTTPDFIPDFAGASNRVAQPTTTSYTDIGVLSEAVSSYYYVKTVKTGSKVQNTTTAVPETNVTSEFGFPKGWLFNAFVAQAC